MTDKVDVYDQSGRKVGEARLSDENLVDRAAVGASAGVLGVALLAIVGVFIAAFWLIFAAVSFLQFAARKPADAAGGAFVVLSCIVATIGAFGIALVVTVTPIWYFYGFDKVPTIVGGMAALALFPVWVVSIVLWLKAMAPLHRRLGRALSDDEAYWG